MASPVHAAPSRPAEFRLAGRAALAARQIAAADLLNSELAEEFELTTWARRRVPGRCSSSAALPGGNGACKAPHRWRRGHGDIA